MSVEYDILNFTPSNNDLNNGESLIVADAGEYKKVTKINEEVFVENLDLDDEESGGNSSGGSTQTNTMSELEFSNGNIIISSEESYFQVRDDSDVIRAQLGQITTDNFGLKVNKSNGGEIFGLYGSTANLCGWNIDENAISKVSGNDYVKLDTSSSQPRLEIAQNNVVRLKAGQLDSDKYGLKIWNASNEVLMEISDGDIAADTANIGGWDITSSSLKKGTNVILDATNKAISINNATFGNSGLQLQYNSGTPRVYFGDGSNAFFKYDGSKITWKASNAELDSDGKLVVTGATIGGWTIASNEISSSSSSSAKRIFLNPSAHRLEVRNTSNAAVVSMGYLGGLAKTSGSGNWADTDYGFWIKQGDQAKIDGDVEYKDGAFLVENEGSFNVADSTNTVIKLGTISSERGLFIGSDLDGTPSVKAKFTNGGFRIGAQTGSGDYISYDTTNGLVVKGSITVENTIGASDLDSTVISGGKIITGLLTADNIQAGTMDADRITAGTIDSSHIDTNSITAAVVTTTSVNATTITADEINLSSATVTGTLAAARIAADSLDADKISTLNMTGKSCTFTTGTIGGWTFDDNAIYRGTEGTSGNFTSNAGDITLGAGFISAKEFYIDSSGVAVFKGTLNSDTDGAISGNSVTITNLNASNISAGTLSADRIAASSIAVGKLDSSIVTSGKIITGLLTADNIQAGTLTGRTVQTSSSGQRIVMDGSSNTLKFYESGGTLKLELKGIGASASFGGTQDGISMENNGLMYIKGSDNAADVYVKAKNNTNPNSVSYGPDGYISVVPTNNSNVNSGKGGGYGSNIVAFNAGYDSGPLTNTGSADFTGFKCKNSKYGAGSNVGARIEMYSANGNDGEGGTTNSDSNYGIIVTAQNPGAGSAYAIYSSTGTCAKSGGGEWASTSDSRVKTVGDNYTTGLSEIIQLEPKYYKYNGKTAHAPDDDINRVGLIAQEAESVIPSLVTKTNGKIDDVDVDDLRELDTSELKFALINAIKELNTRLEALENA